MSNRFSLGHFAGRGLRRLKEASKAMAATAAKAAPARNVADAPRELHREPAMTLANRSAMPLTRLNIPKPVPHNSAGAVSATSLDSRPCVKAMCNPHSAAPTKTTSGDTAKARIISAAMSRTSPRSNNPCRLMRSATRI